MLTSWSSMDQPQSLLRSTLRALLVRRRLVPILLVCVPLVVAQTRLSADPLAAPVGVVMCLAFGLLAPTSWRALFPVGEPVGRPFGRLVVYGLAGAGTVYLVGSLLPRMLGVGPTLLTHDVSLLVSTALFWVGGWGLGSHIDHERTLARERARADALSREAERAQLLALRRHLDPHFLFNTLNAIAEWCREDGEMAERATLELSDLLRDVLAGIRAPAWPLARELELASNFLALHLIRDPAAFELEYELESPLPDVAVPPLLLLPLVENAIKHGPGAGHRGKVVVRCATVGPTLWLEVENPGAPGDPRPGGEGLPMIRKRLELAYGGRATLSLRGQGERTLVSVTLPADQVHPEANT